MEVRRDQRKAVYNFSVHDLVCRNHIDRSGPPAGETRTSTTSRHLKANIYSENMTNAKTLPFSGFYNDQKFYSAVSPANVVILVNDHHFASFSAFGLDANVQESNGLQSRTFWGIFVCYLKRNQSFSQKFPPGMHHCFHKLTVMCHRPNNLINFISREKFRRMLAKKVKLLPD